MDRTDADRADVDVDDLLKVILVLAIVWLLLEIFGAVLDLTSAVLQAIPQLIVVVIVVLIALRLTDRI
jgi:flagellar biosynthesis protein FliQ